MSLSLFLSAAAAAASAALISGPRTRTLALVGLVVAGLNIALSLRLIRLAVRGIDLDLISGAALAVLGGLLLLRVDRRFPAAAATTLTLAGAIEVLRALHFVR